MLKTKQKSWHTPSQGSLDGDAVLKTTHSPTEQSSYVHVFVVQIWESNSF